MNSEIFTSYTICIDFDDFFLPDKTHQLPDLFHGYIQENKHIQEGELLHEDDIFPCYYNHLALLTLSCQRWIILATVSFEHGEGREWAGGEGGVWYMSST